MSTIANIAEEYHVASNNSRSSNRTRTSFDSNFEESIRTLVKEAPLQKEAAHCDLLGGGIEEEDELLSALTQVIEKRRSIRDFSPQPLPRKTLGKLLYLSNGIRNHDSSGMPQRNAPCAGGLGSVEIFAFVLNVDGISAGIYHFNSVNHGLALLREGDYSHWIQKHGIFQIEFSEAAVVLILTSAVGRLASKYGIRGYRLALLDAGHVSQNIQLCATAMDLAVCATGGFVDCEINQALSIDGLDTCAMLAIGLGHKKSG